MDGLSSEVKKDTKITGGGNLILGSESFKNAKLQGNAVSGSSVTCNDVSYTHLVPVMPRPMFTSPRPPFSSSTPP